MKILLFQTRNQSTSKKAPSLSSPPSAYLAAQFPKPPPQLSEREIHTQFVLTVLNGLNLPVASFGSYIKAHITFVSVPPRSPNHADTTNSVDSTCTKYYCSGTSWTITWSYCPSLRHTAAVLFHREGDGDERKTEMLFDLLRLQTHLSHPMLLGYIKTKISLSFTFEMLDDMNRETLALEQAIGFPTWNWVLDRVEPGRGVGDAQDQAVEGFNVLSGKLTNIRFRLRTFQQQIKFISRCNAAYRQSLGSLPPSFQSSLYECDELQSFMDVMWDYTFVHLFDADSLGERLQNAMSSVFQLTTQRDSRASLAIADINNELAWQGRNTNRAMMTIAFLSLLFLPPTFVASFFQTPIFNFPVPTDGRRVVVTEPFWIYWTVSGVLTLGLGLGWMRYLRQKREMDMQEREGERRRFRERLRVRQDVVAEAATVILEGNRGVLVAEPERGFGARFGSLTCGRSLRKSRTAPTPIMGIPMTGGRDEKRRWRVDNPNDLYRIAMTEPIGFGSAGPLDRYFDQPGRWPGAGAGAGLGA